MMLQDPFPLRERLDLLAKPWSLTVTWPLLSLLVVPGKGFYFPVPPPHSRDIHRDPAATGETTPCYLNDTFKSRGTVVKNSLQCKRFKRHGFNPWVRKIPWRKWQPTPVFLLGKSHERRAWRATVHGVAKIQAQLSIHTYTSK